jgi:hypothetical protein
MFHAAILLQMTKNILRKPCVIEFVIFALNLINLIKLSMRKSLIIRETLIQIETSLK